MMIRHFDSLHVVLAQHLGLIGVLGTLMWSSGCFPQGTSIDSGELSFEAACLGGTYDLSVVGPGDAETILIARVDIRDLSGEPDWAIYLEPTDHSDGFSAEISGVRAPLGSDNCSPRIELYLADVGGSVVLLPN